MNKYYKHTDAIRQPLSRCDPVFYCYEDSLSDYDPAIKELRGDACYAIAGGAAGDWLKRSRGYLRFERYVSGVLFIGLGLTAAFAGNQKN